MKRWTCPGKAEMKMKSCRTENCLCFCSRSLKSQRSGEYDALSTCRRVPFRWARVALSQRNPLRSLPPCPYFFVDAVVGSGGGRGGSGCGGGSGDCGGHG